MRESREARFDIATIFNIKLPMRLLDRSYYGIKGPLG